MGSPHLYGPDRWPSARNEIFLGRRAGSAEPSQLWSSPASSGELWPVPPSSGRTAIHGFACQIFEKSSRDPREILGPPPNPIEIHWNLSNFHRFSPMPPEAGLQGGPLFCH